jgi:hypothetical protein
MRRNNNDPFVHDGYDLARSANIDIIRIEVETEYRERLEAAGWFKRLLLRREMKLEVEARLERKAPRDGMYLANQ